MFHRENNLQFTPMQVPCMLQGCSQEFSMGTACERSEQAANSAGGQGGRALRKIFEKIQLQVKRPLFTNKEAERKEAS